MDWITGRANGNCNGEAPTLRNFFDSHAEPITNYFSACAGCIRQDYHKFITAPPAGNKVVWADVLFEHLAHIAKINREDTAPGRVVDMTRHYEYSEEDRDRVIGETYYPVVEFVVLNGKRRNVQLNEGSFPAAYEVGDKVTILYEPDHPLDARIKSFASLAGMWILPGITGILGIAFLGAVLVVRRVMFNSEEASWPTIQSA